LEYAKRMNKVIFALGNSFKVDFESLQRVEL